MSEGVGTVLSALLAAVGVLSIPDTTVLPALAAVAIALAGLCLVALVSGVAPALRDGVALAAPRRERASSVLVAQSDPDARGHARPRAPGRAFAAA